MACTFGLPILWCRYTCGPRCTSSTELPRSEDRSGEYFCFGLDVQRHFAIAAMAAAPSFLREMPHQRSSGSPVGWSRGALASARPEQPIVRQVRLCEGTFAAAYDSVMLVGIYSQIATSNEKCRSCCATRNLRIHFVEDRSEVRSELVYSCAFVCPKAWARNFRYKTRAKCTSCPCSSEMLEQKQAACRPSRKNCPAFHKNTGTQPVNPAFRCGNRVFACPDRLGTQRHVGTQCRQIVSSLPDGGSRPRVISLFHQVEG